MRYIIYGAGAVGGVIGGRLFQNGRDVVLIARGSHLEALRRNGLTLQSASETAQLQIATAGSPAEIEFQDGDAVLLTMKTQDTEAALDELRAAAGGSVPVFCAQNGVENERLALRRFQNVYGITVMLPAAHMEPGVVRSHASNKSGMLDLGRYPSGSDAVAQAVADDLNASDFSVIVRDAVMRWKYAKLLGNLGNALQAACGFGADYGDIYAVVRDEALACYRAAAIDCADADEVRERRDGVLGFAPSGPRRQGGSSWQSLARGTGSIETDFLNGQISLLGRLHNVATPVNSALQHIAARLVREGAQPGSLTPDDVRSEIATLTHSA
ncbi:MAG: ketopantoate reductase family protein [Chloroflexi bacterium]|nr:ketopantoate reductase family protein [Chloroflexota bacterium]